MIQMPVDVFLGKYGALEIVGILTLQATWAVALLLLGRAVLAAATRKLVVQGG